MNGIQKYELTPDELESMLERAAKAAVAIYRTEVEFQREITVEQAALESGKTERTIRNWIAKGSLEAHPKDGRSYVIPYGAFLRRIQRA